MKRAIPPLVCAVMALTLPLVVHAASAVRIHTSWLASDGSSPMKTVQLDVRNVTSGDLQNVDIRLANPDRATLPKGVLQVGTIPAGQARLATGAIVVRSAGPLVWAVDFDDASGHHQELVP